MNAHFSDWATGDSRRRIPFIYNATFSAAYSYLPAFHRFRNEIRAIHFIGSHKPWNFYRCQDGKVCPSGNYTAEHLEYVQAWWDLFDKSVKPVVVRRRIDRIVSAAPSVAVVNH